MPRLKRRGHKIRDDRPLSELSPEELKAEHDLLAVDDCGLNKWEHMGRYFATHDELERRYRALAAERLPSETEIRYWADLLGWDDFKIRRVAQARAAERDAAEDVHPRSKRVLEMPIPRPEVH